MISVMGVLLGIDMQGFGREEGSDELPPGLSRQPPTPPTSPPPKASTSAPPKPKEPEDVKMADPELEANVDDEEAKAKKEAELEKQKGSEAYKKRDFDAAAKGFERAWELWPKDITFLTNLSGVCRPVALWDSGVDGLHVKRSISSKANTTSPLRRRKRLWRKVVR